MISETVSKLLGEPGDARLIQDIKATVRTFPEVKGAYDLILHNYGPDTYNGSVHVEVEDTISPDRLDELSREIMVKVYQTHNVILTAIGFYSVNTQDEEVIGLQDEIEKRVMSHEYVKGMHGFHFNKKDNSVRFDVVISFDAPSRQAVFIKVLNDLKDTYPDIDFTPAMDMDYGEII